MKTDKKYERYASISLILGIISLVTGCFIVGGAAGIFGVVYAVKSLKRNAGKQKLAKSGLITSIIGILFAVIMSVAVANTEPTDNAASGTQMTESTEDAADTEDVSGANVPGSKAAALTSEETELGTERGAKKSAPTDAKEEQPVGYKIGNLEVHYIDVGQGDATLIMSEGHAMLIDAGDNNKGTAVQAYLQNQGVTTLDYVIGTHPDADHIGGLDVILYKFDCRTILMPDAKNDTKTYDDVVAAMKSKNYRVTEPVVGDRYTLGNASFTIIAPNKDYGSDNNNNSVGIILENGKNRFLFTGDAEEEAENDIVDQGIDISADVYKVAHHGSKTATSERFLEKVSPAYAVISVGEDNKYGHPDAAALNALRAQGVKVFRTDEQGTIVAKSDGYEITWNCSPSETWQAGEAKGSAPGGSSSSNSNSSAAVSNGDSSIIVHITDTGSKYHSAGCQYLRKSDHEVTLEQAKSMGLDACSKCNPPR